MAPLEKWETDWTPARNLSAVWALQGPTGYKTIKASGLDFKRKHMYQWGWGRLFAHLQHSGIAMGEIAPFALTNMDFHTEKNNYIQKHFLPFISEILLLTSAVIFPPPISATVACPTSPFFHASLKSSPCFYQLKLVSESSKEASF